MPLFFGLAECIPTRRPGSKYCFKKTEIPIVFAGIEEKSFNQYGEKLIAEIHKNPRACFKKKCFRQ